MSLFKHMLNAYKLYKETKRFEETIHRTENIVPEIKLNKEHLKKCLDWLMAITGVLDHFKRVVFYGTELDNEVMLELARYLSSEMRDIYNLNLLDSKGMLAEPEVEYIKFPNTRLFHSLLGMLTESGEIAEQLAYLLEFPGKVDKTNIAIEFGDSNYYQTIGIEALGTDQISIMKAISDKLRVRYPNKFDCKFAIDRKLEKELSAVKKYID